MEFISFIFDIVTFYLWGCLGISALIYILIMFFYDVVPEQQAYLFMYAVPILNIALTIFLISLILEHIWPTKPPPQ